MAALTADRDTHRREGVQYEFPVKASTKIYAGSIVMVSQLTGYAEPGADSANMICKGVAEERADNSSGSAGDINVKSRYGTFKLGATGMSASNEGHYVYAGDDQTVVLKGGATNDVGVGIIAKVVSATAVWVHVSPEAIAVANEHHT